ncbi:hypothetical protein BC829DRAFT_425405 [Chytridium lagenaria]|nr:hypothetical protein BC829DRAFT_425405 [Chytridium lagenaria]
MESQHRDEFSQFIWKRRSQARRDLRSLFQVGNDMPTGDMIADASLELLHLFEKTNTVRLCKDAINWGLCEMDDIPGFLRKESPSLFHPQTRPSYPWAARLQGKTMVAAMVSQSLDQIRFESNMDENYSYISFLARCIDIAHPSHQLQALLVVLKYDIAPHTEEYGAIDYKFAVDIMKQINWRLELEHQFYFEFSYPNHTQWRVGYTLGSHVRSENFNKAPGSDEWSFGFGSDGSVFYKDLKRPYVSVPEEKFFQGVKTGGLVLDLLKGSISLVLDGRVSPPGFGYGAKCFSPAEQTSQRQLIQSTPQMRVNFGRTPFTFTVDALSCDQSLEVGASKGIESLSIVEHQHEGKEKSLQDEEEKLQIATEKNYYRAAATNESLRGFLAISSKYLPKIQRGTLPPSLLPRRFKGRKERVKIREQQYMAATLIQPLYILTDYTGCIYQQPIPELHRAATVIQRKWRHWSMYRNSPIATRFNARIEDLVAAVNKIILWWRPLYSRISDKRRMLEKHNAATRIQSVYRGYRLRLKLRPDIRLRLRNLGESLTRHRQFLFRVRAAYILQKTWRHYRTRKIRNDKIRTRNRAAAKIQALWKGYWVRSHVHLRFTYGEAVFLTAVCKALRNCHFIVKMYRPCGIVCPKRDVTF